MLSMMAASAMKHFSATRGPARCEKHFGQQWREYTPLLNPAPRRTYPSARHHLATRTLACRHGIDG